MADPSSDDVEAATAVARRYCGWPVTLVEDDEMVLDGPGSPVLFLPTLKVVELVSVTENGVEVDVDTLSVSADGRVRKKDRTCWSGDYSSIEVVVTHGYAEAPDFDRAVRLIALDIANGREDSALIRKRVDDVDYQWSDRESSVPGVLLDQFRLERQP